MGVCQSSCVSRLINTMPKTKMPQEICDLYLTNPSPNKPTISDLAKKHDLDAKKITKFFQNKRAVDKKKAISQTPKKPEPVSTCISVEPEVLQEPMEWEGCAGCALGLENQEGHFGGCIPNPYSIHQHQPDARVLPEMMPWGRCLGCAFELQNQEGHFGGCIPNPYPIHYPEKTELETLPEMMVLEEEGIEKFCLGCALGLEEKAHYGGCIPLKESSLDPMLNGANELEMFDETLFDGNFK